MKNNSTIKLVVVALLALLFVGACVYSTYYINGLIKKTAEIKGEIGQKQLAYNNSESVQKNSQDIEAQKVKIAGYFIPAGGAINFISDLERVAASFGLKYSTQNISQENNDELSAQNKEVLHVSFAATGSWRSVMRLIRFVESLPYGIVIDKIDMNADTGTVQDEASVGSTTQKVVAKKWSATVAFSVLKTKDNAK